MSGMKLFHTMERMMDQMIEEAVRELFLAGNDNTNTQPDDFAHALLVRLGLRSPGETVPSFVTPVRKLFTPAAAAAAAAADDTSSSTDSVSGDAAPAEPAAAERKRTVSKKMKDEFLAAGGDDKQLKAAMKAYKAASDDQVAVGWAAFAAPHRGAADAPPAAAAATPATPAKQATKPAKTDAPKREKPAKAAAAKAERNFTWTPTAKKLFAETVEASGGIVSDLLKDQFAKYANDMSAEQFKALAAVGHMRAFLTKPAAPAVDAPAAAPAADDDEDMESFEFEGEELFIGLTSGKVYRQSEGAGDVLIGVAGQGRFKDVKVPSAE
jgi:hypothetical protein